jgi:omega-6 fatty acid desaturase (delta-12 desaturase)
MVMGVCGCVLQSCRAKRLRLSKSITGCQVSAIATPVANPSPLNDAEERQQLAEKYGFTQIGEPVPSGITLKNVMDTFPPEVCLYLVTRKLGFVSF